MTRLEIVLHNSASNGIVGVQFHDPPDQPLLFSVEEGKAQLLIKMRFLIIAKSFKNNSCLRVSDLVLMSLNKKVDMCQPQKNYSGQVRAAFQAMPVETRLFWWLQLLGSHCRVWLLLAVFAAGDKYNRLDFQKYLRFFKTYLHFLDLSFITYF